MKACANQYICRDAWREVRRYFSLLKKDLELQASRLANLFQAKHSAIACHLLL
jgi:hypothetical protein